MEAGAGGAAVSNRQPYIGQQLAAQLLAENDVLYDKVTAALACRRDDVPVALGEVICFLHLVAKQETGMLTPSHRVDLAWHEFILCTRAYSQFCSDHFGRYIHHAPGGNGQQNRRQYAKTLQLYKEEFGAPTTPYWPTADEHDEGDCGACESA